jgi:hypothetical protein
MTGSRSCGDVQTVSHKQAQKRAKLWSQNEPGEGAISDT